VTLAQRIFLALADGDVHSGEALAASLGVTRSAVWKAIGQLREAGLQVEAQTNVGYRLAERCEPLAAAAIRDALPKEIRGTVAVEVEWEIPSTNLALLAAPPPPPGRYAALLAENQTGGRGRRGRTWLAALGGSLCLSIATSFEPLPRDLAALSLIIGVRVREALLACGARELALKWPNDLVTPVPPPGVPGKVGGILVELRAEAGGAGHVVIGIGLNLRLDASARAQIARLGAEAADLATLGVDVAARNALASAVVGRCVDGLEIFSRLGFAPFLAAWRDADVLRDRPVRIHGGDGVREGIARGIDTQGALQVERADGIVESVLAGEVSVRGAA
jgi:BirA family biotin operon repressor/biotin-[acetyl-CoA-carboxylase] ligase